MEVPGAEGGVAEDFAEKGEIGLNAGDGVFVDGAKDAVDGGLAGGAPGDELGEHGVVVDGDGPAGVDAGVEADAGAGGFGELGDFAGGGEEFVVGVLGVDSAFDGGSAPGDVRLGEGEMGSGGDVELEVNEVEAGDEFGDGVFDLEAGVHFEEVEVAVGVDEEFGGSGVVVAGGPGDAEGGLSHGFAEFGILGDEGGGALLDDLLVAALEGAFAFAEVDEVSVVVAEDLDFDVAGVEDDLFEVDFGAAEGSFGFAGGGTDGGFEFGFGVDAAHAFSASAGGRFEENGVTEGTGGGPGLVEIGGGFFGTGDDGGAGGFGEAAGGGFRTEAADGFGGGSDENEPSVDAGVGEGGVFAEEAVAWVDGVDAVAAGGVEDSGLMKVAFGGRGGAEVGGFIGGADVEGGAVGVGIDGYAADAELAEGSGDADRDLAPVGDQDFLEHAEMPAAPVKLRV